MMFSQEVDNFFQLLPSTDQPLTEIDLNFQHLDHLQFRMIKHVASFYLFFEIMNNFLTLVQALVLDTYLTVLIEKLKVLHFGKHQRTNRREFSPRVLLFSAAKKPV